MIGKLVATGDKIVGIIIKKYYDNEWIIYWLNDKLITYNNIFTLKHYIKNYERKFLK